MENGLKFNWTAKEKARLKLEEEQNEKEAKLSYYNIMQELNIEVVKE